MNILIISTDRPLLGEKIGSSDTLQRHCHYAQYVAKLDIIVFSRPGYQTKQLADNLFCYPTNSSSRLFYFSQAFKIAQQLFSQGFYDLIVCQDPFLTALAGYLIKRKFKSKLLIHFHGDFWQNKYWLKESIFNFPLLLLSKFTVRQADALRVVSPLIKKKLIQAGLAKDKIKVISTPVILDKFKDPNNQTLDSIQQEFSGRKVIFWVGRFSPEKNLSWLLETFAQLVKQFPSVVLLLAGQGKEFNKINQLRLSLGLNQQLKLLGHVDYQQLVNYYHAADIFVLPSLHESFGKVLLEAAASAKPSLASRTTGASTILKDKKTGFLFAINNQKQFIDKALKLLNDQKLAQHMGTAAYQHIQQSFNYQQGVQSIVDYWEEITMDLKLKNSSIK